MPAQQPALSQTDWDKRLYDFQLGTLYPVYFAMAFNPGTGGTLSPDGVTKYFSLPYIPSSYTALAGISIQSQTAYPASLFGEVSFLSTPSFADPTNLTAPFDQGNIVDTFQIGRGNFGSLYLNRYARNFYPFVVPISITQTLYIHFYCTNPSNNSARMSGVLHLIQTGVQN